MKPIPFFGAALVFLLGGAVAHETVQSGNVRLEWHTDTNERLQVNADTTLSVLLKVDRKTLDPRRCRCTLLLYPGDVSPRIKPTVLKWTVGESGGLESVIAVEKPGWYSVVLDGKPLKLNDFTAFRTVLKLEAVEDVYNVPTGGHKS